MPLPQDPGLPRLTAAERERIHQALLDLCFERGYPQVTVAALCERGGVDRAAFDLEYADLEDCFCQVYIVERDRFLAARATACAGLSGWRDRLRASAYTLQHILAQDRKLANFVIAEVRTAGERPLLLMGGVIETMLDLLDQGRGERQDPEAISRATAESIGGSIFNQIYAAVIQDVPLSDDMVQQMMYAAVLPYLGHAAALEELHIPPPPVSDG